MTLPPYITSCFVLLGRTVQLHADHAATTRTNWNQLLKTVNYQLRWLESRLWLWKADTCCDLSCSLHGQFANIPTPTEAQQTESSGVQRHQTLFVGAKSFLEFDGI